MLLRRESAARYTLQALDTAALLAALPPLNGAGEGTLYPEFIPPADLPPLDADGTPCREDAATAALVELFAPDCTRLARWQWLDTGCGCKVRRQTPDGVTTAPDGPDIRASLAAALTGEDGGKDSLDPATLSLSTERLTQDYPRHATSLLNLVKNAEESMRALHPAE